MNTLEREDQRLPISGFRICVAAFGIGVAWIIGLGVTANVAFAVTRSDLSHILPQTPTLIVGTIAALVVFILPGGLAFAIVTSARHRVVMFPYLPETVPSRYFRAAFLGSMGCWLVIMIPLLIMFNLRTFGLDHWLYEITIGAASQLLATLIIGTIGALIGTLGGLVLMSAEWPVLWSYISNARQWAAGLIATSAFVTSAFLVAVLMLYVNGG